MNLFDLLFEVKKLGYEILTYEEAREQLSIEPEEFGEYYISLLVDDKKYFIFKNSSEEVKVFILEFFKNDKFKKIKNTLYYILENNFSKQKRSFQ